MADKLIICASQHQMLFDKRDGDYRDNDLRQHMAENHRSVESANGE